MTVQEGTSVQTRIVSVIGVIVIIAFSLTFFMKGGIPQVSLFGSWITRALYFASIATAIYMLRSHLYRIRDRGPRWSTSALLVIVFCVFLIWNLSGYVGYIDYFSLIAAVGQGGVNCLIAFSYLSSMFRFRTNTWEKAVMATTAVACVTTISPLLPTIFPGTEAISVWLLNYPGTAVTSVLWTTTYIGLAAMLARTFIGKERLSAAGR
jgi:hypothetical protein